MIPVSEPIIAKNAQKYISDCLSTGWVSSKGAYVEKFEQAFARFIGVKYAVTTSSGTAALHLALSSLDIKQGDEIILPTLTMIASVLPILYLGANPILVDSDPETGNIDVSVIEKKITKRTKAIMPVHLYGHPADMDPIVRLAKKNNLKIIEDAAEAHGAEYFSGRNKTWIKAGSIGDIGCFSFYGNKIITTGEGGMAVTNNKQLADRMRSLRNLARSPKKHFLHTELGYAYRMSNIQAALGLAELEEIDQFINKKIKISQIYQKYLSRIKDVVLPLQKPYAKSIFWQYVIKLNKKFTPEKLEKLLFNKGIETRLAFTPLHRQPMMKEIVNTKDKFPVADGFLSRAICLPAGMNLNDKSINFIAKTLNSIFNS